MKENILPIADICNGGTRHYAFTHKGASWRRMLVAQPQLVRVARIRDFEQVDISDESDSDVGSWQQNRV